MGAQFCTACGRPFVEIDAQFCTTCGVPRSVGPYISRPVYLPAPGPYFGGNQGGWYGDPYAGSYARPSGSTTAAVIVVVLAIVVIGVLVGAVVLAIPQRDGGTPCCGPPPPSSVSQVILPAGTNYSLPPGQYVDSLFVTAGDPANGSLLSGTLEGSGGSGVAVYLFTPPEFSNWSLDRAFPSGGYQYAALTNGSSPLILETSITDGSWYLVFSNPSAAASESVTVLQPVDVQTMAPIYAPA